MKALEKLPLYSEGKLFHFCIMYSKTPLVWQNRIKVLLTTDVLKNVTSDALIIRKLMKVSHGKTERRSEL
jgi:hypothetical protein